MTCRRRHFEWWANHCVTQTHNQPLAIAVVLWGEKHSRSSKQQELGKFNGNAKLNERKKVPDPHHTEQMRITLRTQDSTPVLINAPVCSAVFVEL
jgi:hypothetical protein